MAECDVFFTVVVDVEEEDLAIGAGEFDGSDVWMRNGYLFPIVCE